MHNILIVGLGLIGGSYAKGLSKKGYNVFGLDKNIDTINLAYNEQVIKNNNNSIESFFKDIDTVILCLYPDDNVNWLNNNQHLLPSNTLITDVTGVKGKIVSDIKNILRKDLIFIPSHPMAGKEKSGYLYSDEKIFKDANFIITPYDHFDKVDELVKLGNELEFSNIEILTVEEHDDIIGFLSHLTHIIACSLMQAHETDSFIRYTGDSFRDLTRIAKINENLWSELFLANKNVLLKEIKNFKESLSNIEKMLENEDLESLKQSLRVSTERRKAFDKK